ncbi:MAG TPA: FAD-dependent oxidoreductase [Xanthobacteraceae bacterium]|nr:FAD-dependent oxidoreductase [Xanthobacteraceae bacterium]
MATLPGRPDCCWTATAPHTSYPPLSGSAGADVGVIGAGIVGLTAAYLLASAGLSVAVVEALRVGRQVTGRSTAKVTSQHSLIYRHLIETRGIDQAQHYAEANRSGARQICDWVIELGIACDLESKAAYAYASDPARRDEIAAEAEAARRVGFDAEVLDRAPLPFDTAAALRFPDQAQFNPAKYLVGLALAVEAAGGRIFENTRVTAIDRGRRWRVTAADGVLDVEHVVVATNFPFTGPVEYDRSTQPRGHTAMAFRARDTAAIDGMFIGIDEPRHSLRMGRDNEGLLLVVLGPSFKTGQERDVASRFRDLDRWVHKNLPVGETVWRWFNEDYDTADRVPFVGAPSNKAPGFYIATGFNGWGISNGTAAGMLMADQIRGRSNPWANLYAPARPSPKNFNKGGESPSGIASIAELAPGEGGVIKHGKQKLAVWKDDNGQPHALSATCTHKGCTVTWNSAERTWDCLCHGSMFNADGTVIHGPAVMPLPTRKVPAKRPARRPRRSGSQSRSQRRPRAKSRR